MEAKIEPPDADAFGVASVVATEEYYQARCDAVLAKTRAQQ